MGINTFQYCYFLPALRSQDISTVEEWFFTNSFKLFHLKLLLNHALLCDLRSSIANEVFFILHKQITFKQTFPFIFWHDFQFKIKHGSISLNIYLFVVLLLWINQVSFEPCFACKLPFSSLQLLLPGMCITLQFYPLAL